MSNVLKYVLELQDKMSVSLKKVGISANSTKSDVKNLKDEVNSLNNLKLDKFSNTFKRTVASLGIGYSVSKVLQTGMEQGMKNVSFEVLFGGEEPAKRMIDNINNYAAKAYGKSAVTNSVQMMRGFGIATEEIMPSLQAIGDIAMGDTGHFQSLTLAFSQMSSTGKLMGQDLLQMVNAGFNPLTQMSKTTGKSVAQLKDEMSKGLITSEMVAKAFKDATSEGGLFHGMIEKISNTAGGQWQKVLSNVQLRMLDLYNIIEPYLIPALKALNKFLSDPIGTIGRLVDKVTKAYPVISGAIIGITAAIVGYKVAILALAGVKAVITGMKAALFAYEIVVFAVKNATSLWTAAQWLLNVALSLNPIGLIIASIVALIAVISWVIFKTDGWGNMWQHTVNGAKLIFKAFVESIKLYFNTMINGLMIGLNKIKEGWYSFKEAVGLGDSSENQLMLEQIRRDTDNRKQEIVGGAKTVADLSIQAAEEFKKAGQSLSWNDTSFSDAAKSIKNKLGIKPSGIPGTDINSETGLNAGLGSTGTETANSIVTGGTKTTHVTINLDNLVGDMTITPANMQEGAEKARDIVLDEFTRLLAMAQGQLT